MRVKKVACIVLSVFIMMFQSALPAFAHGFSQAGILASTYMAEYGDFYVGGEAVGWSIDESLHTNGTTLTYSFSLIDTNLTDSLKAMVLEGASLWAGTVSINNTTGGTGYIRTFNNVNTSTIAQFTNWTADPSTGHLTYWNIEINRSKNVQAVDIAHEFGHAIGLNDLYSSVNSDKLMYGYAEGTAARPTSSDIWGAKVITGVHTTHYWGYKYYSTNSNINSHIMYCTQCNGLSTTTETCTYNTQNICTKCGIPYGYQPYNFRKE